MTYFEGEIFCVLCITIIVIHKIFRLQGIFMLNYDIKAIDKKVNELLSKYDNIEKNPLIDPSVDIEKIAKAYGIEKIEYVSPTELHGEHAIFEDGVVKIDENDAIGQRLFNIAHEVGHIIFDHINMSAEYTVARQGRRRESELAPQVRQIEDLADHFAANLLVPIHRFQLWEHREDKAIAQAFKVEIRCIKRRRQEIGPEMSILLSAMKPCSIDEIIDPSVDLNVEALLKEATI